MGNSQSVWLRVDFGVVETSAALVGADGASWPLRLNDRAAAMPSGVYLSPSTGLEVGAIAREYGVADPNRYVAEPKRWIDDGRPVCELGGTAVPVHVVVAAVLRAVINRAQAECGWQLPAGLVLTHPQRWTAAQTQVLVAAAAEAGYAPDRLRLVAETPENVPVSGYSAQLGTVPAVGYPARHEVAPNGGYPAHHEIAPNAGYPVQRETASVAAQFVTHPGSLGPQSGVAQANTASRSSVRLTLLIALGVVVLVAAVVTGLAMIDSGGGGEQGPKEPFEKIAVGRSQGVGYTAVDPVDHRAYTSDTSSNTVSVIDTVAKKTITQVQIDSVPRSLAVDPQNHTLWVLSGKYQDGLGLKKIDTTTNTVVGTATAPDSTREIAVHPVTHEVYTSQANGDVVDRATGARVVASTIDPTTLQINGRVLAPGHGIDIAINPDNGQVYLYGGDDVKIVDPTTKSVVKRIESPVRGQRMVVDPRTNTAFASSETGIVVIDLAGGAYVKTIGIGHKVFWLAIDPAVGKVYAPETGASGTARLTVIDTATRAVASAIDMGGSAEGLAADPVSHKVYVRPLRSYVYVVDPCASVRCG
ncbi:YncE family protein [Nocardia arthritidis]|uniref:YncE family protein n=1 Tax=Nocardia arthritidis TaxID=228602 RepID=A0A6G9YQ78_9NOCA|nr:YncE family protein [Nocardia arthritidis]QIS15455.1 hypothetical protein F5544_38145 [Nocardia arthritidis]